MIGAVTVHQWQSNNSSILLLMHIQFETYYVEWYWCGKNSSPCWRPWFNCYTCRSIWMCKQKFSNLIRSVRLDHSRIANWTVPNLISNLIKLKWHQSEHSSVIIIDTTRICLHPIVSKCQNLGFCISFGGNNFMYKFI